MTLPPHVSDLAPFDLLVSVAETGSVGAAARVHGITQPAASARIRQLERRLGLDLVVRSPRGSTLTPDGELVVGWARSALDAAAALDAGVRSLHGRHDVHLAVAASMTIAEYLLPRWLAALRVTTPDVTVSLSTANSDEVAARVARGDAAIGFVEGPHDPDGLTATVVGHDELVVVVAPDHPWASTPRIDVRTLAATPLVAREPGSGTREYLDDAVRSAGAVLVAPVLELASTTAIKAAVREGVGPAVVSRLTVADELGRGTVVAVDVDGVDLHRTLRLVRRHDQPSSDAVSALMSVIGAGR